MAAFAVLVLLAHLLFAQLTLVLAVVFAGVSKASRWRLWWLAAPAAAGLSWTLAAGVRPAAGGFAAGPAHILGYVTGGGHPLDRLLHPHGAFAGVGGWLPRQFPIALIAAAAEAALLGWLDWVHTDEWAVRPRRPGLLAAARGAAASRVTRAGGFLTRDGCVLGVAPATGARVVLGWPEMAGGVLVTGADAQAPAVSSLQVVHAALRRRKPVIAVDLSGAGALGGVLGAACAATGTPLRSVGEPPAGHWPGDTPLARAVRERSAVLFSLRTPDAASRVCAEILALAGKLRGIGVDGDALVWLYGYEPSPAGPLAGLVASLVAGGGAAGLPVLVTTTSPAAAAELAGLVSVVLVHRLADAAAAAILAARTGTRLVPAGLPGGEQSVPVPPGAPVPQAGASLQAAAFPPPGAFPQAAALPQATLKQQPAFVQRPGLGQQPGIAPITAAAAELVPRPAVPARTLLSLGPGEFVLAVSSPAHRLVELARAVPARLARGAGP